MDSVDSFSTPEKFGYKCSFLMLLFSRQGAKGASEIEDPHADLQFFKPKIKHANALQPV